MSAIRIVRGAGIVTVLFGVLSILAGCNPGQNISRDDVMKTYQGGDYAKALQQAETRAQHTSGRERVDAQFVAGMSAYHVGKEDVAIRYLSPLITEKDPAISGPTYATLGLIYAGRHSDELALQYMTQATTRLKGEDQARAYYHMGLIEQNLGRWSSARSHLSLAISHSTDLVLRRAIQQDLSNTAFALQLGAYSRRDLAEKRAVQVAASARRANLSGPLVVTSVDSSNHTFYLVQVGRFNNYTSARDAMRRLGETPVMVARINR